MPLNDDMHSPKVQKGLKYIKEKLVLGILQRSRQTGIRSNDIHHGSGSEGLDKKPAGGMRPGRILMTRTSV
jgi:hypothetical protein